MKFALVNPPWTFEGSIYFGCPEPHLPLEFGYAASLLRRAGHEAMIIDGHLEGLPDEDIKKRLDAFRPDFTVLTTAPGYLFWRCPPPELRVPRRLARAIRKEKNSCGTLVVVGPHASVTPGAVLGKLEADAAILGEFEEILPRLAADPAGCHSICLGERTGAPRQQKKPAAADLAALPALHWPAEFINRHLHHHHRFDAIPHGAGAEVESSRGCPYSCSFCARRNFRDQFRRRPLAPLLEEIDGLLEHGVEYIYFIDELFFPDEKLLASLAPRNIRFGIQTRIDLWSPAMLDALGEAGCVSIEAGVESVTEEGRRLLGKKCALDGAEITARLACAKKKVPFVQANLLFSPGDDRAAVERWREDLINRGVWVNKPVPLFPYPGSNEYEKRWGEPDDLAWERAHLHYLESYGEFSDIQASFPLPIEELELSA